MNRRFRSKLFKSEECVYHIPQDKKINIKEEKMKAKFIFITLSITLFFIITSCATFETARHKYIMRGQILEATADGVYLCIGSADGAEVGQELKVYRFVRVPGPRPPEQPNFRKEETGTVKITEIVDEHFAKAKILTGEARENYIVELYK